MDRKSALLTFLAFFVGIFLVDQCNGLAAMSIDIGSEWMKVAIVSPGVPMEIVLNNEAKRKTPATIAFRDGERTFGEDAQVVGTRFPQNSFSYLLDLLGKSIDHPMVQLYQKRFPYYDIITDDERQTIAFRLDKNTTYTPEELLAQLFSKAREFARVASEPKINEAVITVPGYFNQAERRALLQAAEIAGIKVLQLINDYTAIALNYAIFHSKEINDTQHYIIFYDMGASSTTATVVGYQNVKTKERGFLETHPQVTILGVGYDRTLGGLEMQIRLQKYLAQEFDNMKKTPNSVFKNPRAMAKLLKEAGRLKNVLSANADHYAQIEGLLDDKDFKLQVSREKFEELCSDLFERVADPIKMALDTSGLYLDIISQVVLVGGGTRVPKVQEKLTEFVKTELSKNINTDEAATLGAVYKAAELSQGFKVKKFITKDSVLFPIQIVFERNAEKGVKWVKITLFSKMNAYPQKKIITFNKHTQDFEFYVNYAELDHFPAKEIENIGYLNISTVALKDVAKALEKQGKEGGESKGIKAHFAMDESGILKLLNVESVAKKVAVSEEEEGTFSKLGSTISKLFTGSDEKEQKKQDPVKEDVKPTTEEPAMPETKTPEDESTTSKPKVKDEKATNKTEKEEKEKEKKPTIVTLKEPIDAVETKFGWQVLAGDKLTESLQKIKALDLYEQEKKRRETALNNLESFVIDARQKLESDEYKSASKPEDIEKILQACSEMSDWLYEEGFDATAKTLEDKLLKLKELTNDLYDRVLEHRNRPEIMGVAVSVLNNSRTFLKNMRNLNVSTEIFTLVEMETLERVIKETQDYYDVVEKAVNETALHEPIPYKVRDIALKLDTLDREVKYLVNKLKIWKPKQETPATNSTKKAPKVLKPESGDGKVEEEIPSGSGEKDEKSSETVDSESEDAKVEEEADETEKLVELPETEATESESTDNEAHEEL